MSKTTATTGEFLECLAFAITRTAPDLKISEASWRRQDAATRQEALQRAEFFMGSLEGMGLVVRVTSSKDTVSAARRLVTEPAKSLWEPGSLVDNPSDELTPAPPESEPESPDSETD